MIRIRVERTELIDLVDQKSANWRTRAGERRNENVRAGRHVGSNIWSDIKSIMLRLQHDKCAYCERQLESGPVEWDVEHYRPKGKVDEWPSTVAGVTDIGGADKDGYFRLAYDLSNYLVACKPCNTDNKKNYFPTAAPRNTAGANPAHLWEELPYLINPMDSTDADPETLIRVAGLIPRAAAPIGFDRDRALVTIDVLGLTREGLVRERAAKIVEVYLALQGSQDDSSPEARAVATRVLNASCSTRRPHTNCARVFRALCETDPVEAERILYEALAILESPGS